MNENHIQELREAVIRQYSITEENEPSPDALKKTKKEVGAMKPAGGEVKMPKARTDPSRNYTKEAMKTGAENAKARIAASHAKPDRVPKTTKPPGMSNDERKAETKKITTARVQGGTPSTPVTDKEIGDSKKRKRPIATATKTTPQKALEATQYKRIGIALAESMGLRIDEVAFLAPIAAGASRLAAVAGRGVAAGAKAVGKAGAKGVKAVGKMAKEKATDMAKDKLKDKLNPASEEEPQLEGTAMSSYLRKLLEFQVRPIAQNVAKRSPGGADSRMSDHGDKPVSKDPVVARQTNASVAKLDKKIGKKTNVKTDVGVQLGLDARRAAAKRGKSVEGSPPIPRETKKDAAADAAHSRKKVSDAGEQ